MTSFTSNLNVPSLFNLFYIILAVKMQQEEKSERMNG